MLHASPTPSARTMIRRLAIAILATVTFAGCNRAPTTTASVVVSPSRTTAAIAEYPEFPGYPPESVPLSPRARYETALSSASMLLNEGKLADALTALRQLQNLENTPMVADAIATTEAQLAAAAVAEQVTAEIRALLNDGRPEQAAQLALDALRVFGDGSAAPPLVVLRRAAAALGATPTEQPAQLARLQKEVQDAAAANNLRGAVLILERTATELNNSSVKHAYDQLQDRLGRYDRAMARAASERLDPQRINDALESLREAAKAWDTREVRRMIDECLLAIRSRRERIVLADFDVRGDVAAVVVSRAVADQMTAALQSRFELVERDEWI